TLCNLGIECGARTAFIAPDAVTLDYLDQRLPALAGDPQARQQLLSVRSDDNARYDVERSLQVDVDAPQFTWGTNPSQVVGPHEPLPAPEDAADASVRQAAQRAYEYMGLQPGRPLHG